MSDLSVIVNGINPCENTDLNLDLENDSDKVFIATGLIIGVADKKYVLINYSRIINCSDMYCMYRNEIRILKLKFWSREHRLAVLTFATDYDIDGEEAIFSDDTHSNMVLTYGLEGKTITKECKFGNVFIPKHRVNRQQLLPLYDCVTSIPYIPGIVHDGEEITGMSFSYEDANRVNHYGIIPASTITNFITDFRNYLYTGNLCMKSAKSNEMVSFQDLQIVVKNAVLAGFYECKNKKEVSKYRIKPIQIKKNKNGKYRFDDDLLDFLIWTNYHIPEAEFGSEYIMASSL